ncbi:hypothetical protein JCM18549_10740 [Halolamina salina]
MAPRAGDPRVADRLGAELGRQRLEQLTQFAEGVEHLLVPGRIGAPASDCVAPVPSVLADRPEQFQPALQRVADGLPQRERGLPGQPVRLAVDGQPDRTVLTLDRDRGLVVREEPDQERADSA